jgi:hypothetical protein
VAQRRLERKQLGEFVRQQRIEVGASAGRESTSRQTPIAPFTRLRSNGSSRILVPVA